MIGPLIVATNSFSEEKNKEDLYSQLNRGIIRLEHVETIKKEGADKAETINKPDGTGFFVQSSKKLFVVSARHVVEQSYDLHSRVECLNKTTNKKEIILLKLKKQNWIFHPENGDNESHYVDVAATRINWIRDRSIKYFSYTQKKSSEEALNNFPDQDPIPPRKILVFGFPLSIGFEILEQRPFGRAGIISMQTGKKFLRMNIKGANKLAEERCYIIDAEIFPGNSGSPIINQTSLIDSKLQLLGLISASNIQMDFAIAEPVSRIRETIEIAKNQKINNLNCWSLIKDK